MQKAIIQDEMGLISSFNEMFKHAPIGIFQTTLEGEYISVNPMLANIYGYETPQDLIESLTNIEQQLYREENRRHQFHEALLKHNRVTDFESEVRRKDGKVIWISESARLVTGPDNTPLYFEGFVKHIDEQKMLQHHLSDLTENLERRILERTQELEKEAEKRRIVEFKLRQTLKEVRQATEVKSTFLASMSHELRTPLNSIIGFSDLIKSAIYGPMVPTEYGEYVDIIHNSGSHLLALIDDILDLSKIEADKLDLNLQLVSIHSIVDDCLTMVEHRASQSGVQIIRLLDDKVLSLTNGDPRRIKQIFLNLLSNAIKFTPKGGRVTLTNYNGPDNSISISVQDTGIGISPEDLTKVMGEYGQAEHGLDNVAEGTGLGLPISKKLVELHGGTLRLDSEINVGTTIIISLPKADMDDIDTHLPAVDLK